MGIKDEIEEAIDKIDDEREFIEDFLSDNFLAKIDASTTVDEVEEKAIVAGLECANAYLTTYGVPTIPDSIKTEIAKQTVTAIGKANKLLQKQLKKKSKGFLARHSEQAAK